MTTKSTGTARFYDSEYWQKGAGKSLWQIRKLQAFILEISNEDTPPPFLTVVTQSDYDDTVVGWIASWNDAGEESLTVSFEEEAFLVYSMWVKTDKAEESVSNGLEFWYNFGDTGPKEEVNSWDELDNAVRDARKWLEDNREILKKTDSLKQIFNLV